MNDPEVLPDTATTDVLQKRVWELAQGGPTTGPFRLYECPMLSARKLEPSRFRVQMIHSGRIESRGK